MGKSFVPCHELLARIAPRRAGYILEKCPGVLELCSSCTRKLQYRKESEPSSKDSIHTYGREKGKTDLLEDFGHLSRKRTTNCVPG